MRCCTLGVLLVLLAGCYGHDGDSDVEYTVTDECWFDIEVKDMDGPGQDFKGRVVIGLFGNIAPMTVLNFASLCGGYQSGDDFLHYANSSIHRIVPDFVVQAGDITSRDGIGSISIFGDRFNDETFVLSHRSPGWVAMANHGKDTNGSQFYILLARARWLNNRHVVFGKVVRGFELIEAMGEIPVDQDTSIPRLATSIVDSGLTKLQKPYTLSEHQLDSVDDL